VNFSEMRFLSKFYKIWFAGLFKSENEMDRMSLECTKNPCIAVGILYLWEPLKTGLKRENG